MPKKRLKVAYLGDADQHSIAPDVLVGVVGFSVDTHRQEALHQTPRTQCGEVKPPGDLYVTGKWAGRPVQLLQMYKNHEPW